jgi:hypothetical protein
MHAIDYIMETNHIKTTGPLNNIRFVNYELRNNNLRTVVQRVNHSKLENCPFFEGI